MLATFHIKVLASPLPHPCKKTVQPQQALERITRSFMIVEDAYAGKQPKINYQEVYNLPPRKRRDVTSGPRIQGSTACPWQWKDTKLRPNEIPSKLTRAVCPDCGHFCHPVKYAFRVLVKDGCDPDSGVSIWRWKQRRIPIAYIYKSE